MKRIFKVMLFMAIVAMVSSCATPIEIDWNTKGSAYRGQNGKTFTFSVKGGGRTSSIWGTDIYTDDSSLAVAAVHAGKITFDKGGVFTVEIMPSQPSYTGSDRNGVSSGNWGYFDGSFAIK